MGSTIVELTKSDLVDDLRGDESISRPNISFFWGEGGRGEAREPVLEVEAFETFSVRWMIIL